MSAPSADGGVGVCQGDGTPWLLEIAGLSKRFDLHEANRRVVACCGIHLRLRPGEFVGITGKSGSGKSTILRSVYRTNLPQAGSIWYDSARFGRIDLARTDERSMVWLRRFEIGYISQFLSVLPRTTAFDAVLQSALDSVEEQGEDALERARSEARRLLAHFDLPTTLWGLYPRTFSGGEKLRLNIAMAMIKRPRLLLLDEPTASLDNASKLKVRELIERLKEDGTTMLGIFHDLDFMEGICDREHNMQEGLLDG
ncbi:MAG: ATP-binding cassette domain-containing protein [Coriobacteriales bacterium]|jgi:alpha-D-ribose 1-methylphosphonate 5-triphosphate synthase subunit PhnL|nr:ATP-binding cassette domain-containing protein [Coriobacteriales bacterium]